MKRQIRQSCFETNSSSSHSLVVCDNKTWNEFKEGRLFYNTLHESNGLPEFCTLKDIKFYYMYTPNTIFVILMGIILAISTVIPGISTTVLFNIFGFYGTYLDAIKNLEFKILIPLGISFVITTFLLSLFKYTW